MNRPWRVVCPQCGHNFAASQIVAYRVTRLTKVEPRPNDAVRAERRGGKLERQAADRVRVVEKAEVLGELHAIRNVLSERRAAIAGLREEEAALRKKLRELEAR